MTFDRPVLSLTYGESVLNFYERTDGHNTKHFRVLLLSKKYLVRHMNIFSVGVLKELNPTRAR